MLVPVEAKKFFFSWLYIWGLAPHFQTETTRGREEECERTSPYVHLSVSVCVMCRLAVIPAERLLPCLLSVDSLKSCPSDNVPSCAGVPLIYFSGILPRASFLSSPPSLCVSVMCSGVSAGTECGSDWVSDSSWGEREREGGVRDGKRWEKNDFFGGVVSILGVQRLWINWDICAGSGLNMLWPCVAWVRYMYLLLL